MLIYYGNENKKAKDTKKCIIKRNIKFKDYKNCLEANQLENEINLKKIKNNIEAESHKDIQKLTE